MVLGQSAATAAVQAIEANVPVQNIRYDALKEKLIADGQVLTWTGPVRTSPVSLDPQTLDGIVVDDEAATRTGFDAMSHSIGPFVASGYRHDENTDKGHQSIQFPLTIQVAGVYEVRIAYTPNPNRATNVPVVIRAGDKSYTVKANQRLPIRISAMDVIAEACRYAGATPHVVAPQPPRVLHGLGPADLQVWYAQLCVLADAQRTPVGTGTRKQRADTPILLGAVASYPEPPTRRFAVRRMARPYPRIHAPTLWPPPR